jgi:hypothetical protein
MAYRCNASTGTITRRNAMTFFGSVKSFFTPPVDEAVTPPLMPCTPAQAFVKAHEHDIFRPVYAQRNSEPSWMAPSTIRALDMLVCNFRELVFEPGPSGLVEEFTEEMRVKYEDMATLSFMVDGTHCHICHGCHLTGKQMSIVGFPRESWKNCSGTYSLDPEKLYVSIVVVFMSMEFIGSDGVQYIGSVLSR